jgi:preprotein translocase SecE subunit
MPPVRDDEKPTMATNVVAAGSEEPDDREPSSRPPRGASTGGASDASFFAIYKKGQGYWTRMLTAGGVLLILLLAAQFLYFHALAAIEQQNTRLMIAGGFIVAVGVLSWWLMNKPGSVDFLIATDSEMKKVNWTSRAELIGSTKVVILFMFLISIILFGIDLLFGYFFYWIGVLKFPPL